MAFEIICELEPPTSPQLGHVRRQINTLRDVATAFLVPDNHLGRATVSSIAVAHEVAAVGGRSIACLNARDRNLLAFRRDLLTAAAYGVSEFLFVYGDDPAAGQRTGQLTVREMLHETRTFGSQPSVGGPGGFRAGAATRLTRVPRWKLDADFLFVQISFDLDVLVRWRETIEFDGPVYAGVIVLPSVAMARKLAAGVREITIPDQLFDSLDASPDAGVDAACELVNDIRESGAFDGVHLVPVNKYRAVARRLR